MNNASLVMFTLFVQISVGVLAATLFHIRIRTGGMGPIPVSVLSVCLGLIAAGLFSALAHLKKPENAFHAVSNIGRSWLSREIMAVSLLACGIGLLWILTGLGIFFGFVLLEAAVLAFGVFTLWTMSQVYRLRTVPVWNHRATPIDFFGTALLSGGMVSAILDVMIAGKGVGPGLTFLVCSGLGLVCKIAAISLTVSNLQQSKDHVWYADSRKKISRPSVAYVGVICLYILGAALLSAGYFKGCLPYGFLFSSLGVTLLAEILHRQKFYDSFCRIGL